LGYETYIHVFSWPWLVYLDFRGRKWCGGTLIHPKYVLTAVHCVHRESMPKIVIGAHDKNDPNAIIVKAKRITLFPEFYKPVDWNNDIAIIELETAVPLSDKVMPLCLPPAEAYMNPTLAGPLSMCVAAGWGADRAKNPNYPVKLQEVNIKLLQRKTCLNIPGYENQVTNKMFCAGHLEGGKDTCQGDSGGPLMCKLVGPGSPWVLYGITSWGIGCAQRYTPGVYVKVSKFIDWIESETGVSPSIKVLDYLNLAAMEPLKNFPDAKEVNVQTPNYFAANIQSPADSWEIQHHVQSQKTCGGEIWGPSGTIKSDGYPFKYQPRQYCKWWIRARDTKNLIVLTFKDISLDTSDGCILNDHIMVFDYNNEIVGTPQCRLARKTQWTVTGRRHLSLYFNTNEKVEGKGFLATFKEVPDPEKIHSDDMKEARTCGGKWRLEALPKVQRIISPGFPSRYPINTNCFWRIRAPTERHKVHLQFREFNIEPSPPGKAMDCEYDFVKVYTGITSYIGENLIGELCGKLTAEEMKKIYRGDAGQSLFITFNSDNRGTGKGFSAYYVASKYDGVIPKPTLSPSMQRYVLSNSKPTKPNGKPMKITGKSMGNRRKPMKVWNLSAKDKKLLDGE
jgi:hypothetical protein